MTFANPQAWHLLWLLPLIAAALHLFFHHRRRMIERFAQEHLVAELAEGFSIKLYRIKAVLIMAAFVLMVAALARPQWGYTMREVKRHGLDIMVAIDVSKSMLTQDVKPSRLERTKLAVKDLVMKLDGADHIGLIAFAGNAMLMCPLTYDYNGFLLSLDDLNVNTIPRGGTNIAQAIDESVKAYEGRADSDKAVVLITDGEEEEGDAAAIARQAKDKGIRIYTVGVGTREGDLILVPGNDGQTAFFKDADGNVVKSHLNENLLQQIAYITGGAYIRSGAQEFGLDYLYDRQLSKLKKHDEQEKMARIYDERFQWPLTLALLFLLFESVYLTRKTFLLIIAILFFVPTNSFASIAGDVNKANELSKRGQLEDSLKLYQEALGKAGDSSVIKYDLGTALYKKGDYEKARKYFEEAAQDKNLKLKGKAEYNLGNTLFKAGVGKEKADVDQAIKTLQDALGQYGQAINEDPQDQDAKFNQEVVNKEIKRLKEQKQKQHQNQQKNQQKNQQNQQQNQKNQDQQKQDQQNQKQQNQQEQKSAQDQQDKQKQDQQQQQQQQQQNQEQGKEQKKKQTPEEKAKAQQKALDKAETDQKELDRKQAEDLLEDYRENQEPKKLLNYRSKKLDDRAVLKDW